MSITGDKINPGTETDKTRRTIFIVAGIIAALLIGLLVFFMMRKEPAPPQDASGLRNEKLEERFQGVMRAGSPGFEEVRGKLVVGEPGGEYQTSLAGGMTVTMASTVGNFTGRTISGMEMKGTILDAQDKVIKERTVIVIPSETVPELDNNQTVRVPLRLSGITNQQDRDMINADLGKLKVEVTALKLK